MIEPGANRRALRSGLAEHRSPVVHGFAVSEVPRRQRQAVAHVDLVGGMNVVGIADIDGDCHGSVAQAQRVHLLLAKVGPVFVRSGLEVGDLHVEKGKRRPRPTGGASLRSGCA